MEINLKKRHKMVVAIINNQPFIQTPFFETAVKLLFNANKVIDLAWMNVKAFPVDYARNEAVKRFLKADEYKDIEWLAWLDTDMTFPPDMYSIMFKAIEENPQIKVISGVYFKKNFKGEVVAWSFDEANRKIEPTLDGTIQPVKIFGPGASIIHRSVLEKIGYPWFQYGELHEELQGIASEDIHFCNRAEEEDIKIWIHTGIICGHLMQVTNTEHKIEFLGPGAEEYGKIMEFDNIDDVIKEAKKGCVSYGNSISENGEKE
jgi:hypothetical protein